MIVSDTPPRILRKETPPPMSGNDGYLKSKEFLRRDFMNRCAYCMIHENFAGGPEQFWIDHFQPQSKGGAVNDYENLYWTCMSCNHIKGDHWPSSTERTQGYRFADPCKEQDYGHHFQEDTEGFLQPQTKCGEYHCLRIRLNRPSRVTLRQQRNQIKARIEEAHRLAKACLESAQTAEEEDYLNQIVSIIASLEAGTVEAIPAYGPLS